VVEVVEQKLEEIALASLKEKFGLTDSKIGGIIRDAENFGKIKRAMNGSYVSAEEGNQGAPESAFGRLAGGTPALP
jgi:hypothetical protein